MLDESTVLEAATLSGDKNLVPPTVDISLNSDGLLPVAALTSPVPVLFPVWPAVTLLTSYQLLWDHNTIGEVKTIQDDDKPGDILTLEIPADKLTSGKHALAYRLVNLENGVSTDSPATPIEIDRTAPGKPLLAPLIFPSSVQEGLTSAELEDMGNVLQCLIAGYSDMKEDDVVRTYWGNVEGPVVSVDKDDMGLKRVMVDFPRSFLESIGDIEAPVYYTVTDLAGNLSMNAQAVQVKLQLHVLPMLPLPRVKEAQGNVLDPINAVNGATVLVDASAQLHPGDRVVVQWSGPKGSDSKEKLITDAESGKEIAVLFSAVLVEVNAEQTVNVAYSVKRANGSQQTSETLALKIHSRVTQLPAPTMDTVGPDNVLTPSLIPDSGATVRVNYAGMSAGDRVVVQWKGVSSYDTPAQDVGSSAELQFNVPKSFITQSIGGTANVTYTVTREGTVRVSAPLPLSVKQGLNFDTSPVTLSGKVYLLPGSPDLLPAFPADTTLQRTATGGQAPYIYSSSNNQIARVDENGLTSVRGKGTATISVTDAQGATASYDVSVTGVIHCLGLGSGNFAQMNTAAGKHGARIPNSDELNQIFSAYGNRWPMGNSYYWSSTVAAQNLVGMKWYVVKNLVTGANEKLKYLKSSLCVAIR